MVGEGEPGGEGAGFELNRDVSKLRTNLTLKLCSSQSDATVC